MATQSAWTDELKAKVIEMYEQAGPTARIGIIYFVLYMILLL